MPTHADPARVPLVAKVQGHFDASHGELLIGTNVTGRAAKMGHRLTIAMERWTAAVSWTGNRPTAATLTVEVDSLKVLRGDGGLAPLSPPEKGLIRTNALKCLGGREHGRIQFECSDIRATDDGYRLAGTVQIHGRTKPHLVTVRVTELAGGWQLAGETRVSQGDFGVRRYSMLMGAMQVADEVTVSLSATVPAEQIRGA